MKLLIRYIKTEGQGEEIEEAPYSAEKILVGRGTDQDIQLTGAAVALSHSQIAAYKNGFKVNVSKGNQCVFEKRLVDSCFIKIGDEIGISGHVIKLLPGGDDYDVIFEVYLQADSQVQLRDRFKIRVYDLNISKRGWSWILFSTVMFCGLLIPISGFLSPLWMDMVRGSALPDDSFWLAGDLNRAHKFIGDDCEQCHVEAFTQVADTQCINCHQQTHHHVDATYYGLPDGRFNECTDCHKEHSDSFDLSMQSQKICAACHQNLEQTGLGSISYGAATDFEHVHPSFKASILHPKSDQEVVEWEIHRQSLSDPNITEQSNLKFSHQLHLHPKGINGPEGTQVLQCVDCHQTEPGGTTMLTINMEQHCQSCHQLTFDDSDPNRVVPHGSPEDVVVMLREYYGFRYVYQNLLGNEDLSEQEIGQLFEVREARRPGRQQRLRKETTEILDANTAEAIEELARKGVRTEAIRWAESRAYEAASNLFERQACLTCHVVSDSAGQGIPWVVEPIRLTKKWFPLAEFSHESHELMECQDCHDAYPSKVAQDVLMPDIDNCRSCHGGEHSQQLIPSSCTECHQYHFEEGSLIPEPFHRTAFVGDNDISQWIEKVVKPNE